MRRYLMLAVGVTVFCGINKSWSHPAIIDGRLFVRYDTNIYCYDIKAK
jgi:hypothetical protein